MGYPFPGSRRRYDPLIGILLHLIAFEKIRLDLEKGQHSGGYGVGPRPGEPVPRLRGDIEEDKAIRQRGGHLIDIRSVLQSVTCGNTDPVGRQSIFAYLTV